ncbi:ATP-dependent sacrificial sulfur transferase LarE [Gimesia panareensis]|uniref:GMP synthase subunit B n=1 Tax=Gimesia panareensis TaxID=2527978 RepID=A0A518A4X8_9PLAN|nr:ATP-dependent sacrificial sulfur transferase LarE [Gimesia panareensis]QDT27404.1 GMP synthase subunit B [Gimesia panareensis]QDU49764.1 GMP synthase subunit B [Gimesia panareensis]
MSLPAELSRKTDQLQQILAEMDRIIVAFSAGVDSTVVAKAAFLARGDQAQAVTAVSPSLATGEKEEAIRLAELIGIPHRLVSTSEFTTPEYRANASNRCFFCKTELYQILSQAIALDEWQGATLVNGANLDDRGDHRPGMQAAADFEVRSPLIEAGLTKAEVRELARHWELPIWNKPAHPCLSSRIAYGVEVTEERVRRIDAAERFLREEFDILELRVRLEPQELARIEVPLDQIPRLTTPTALPRVTQKFLELGFQNVTLDLQGFRSGSMNSFLSIEELQIAAQKS